MSRTTSPDRAAHLVGSTPFRDTAEALDILADQLGRYLRTVPDGETGSRRNWIQVLIQSFFDNRDLQSKRGGPEDYDYTDYDRTPSFRVRDGHTLTGDSFDFGYLRAFRASYPEFQKRRDAFSIPGNGTHPRFQVGIPGDLDLAVSAFGSPIGGIRHRGAFRDATLRDIRAIHDEAGDDVVFQVEIPVELVALTKIPRPLHGPISGYLAGGVARLAREAPEGSRWGIHLCLGDFNHRAMGRLPDVGPIVRMSNDIVKRWPAGRTLDFVHAPLAAAAEPPPLEKEFYEPLRDLNLPAGTRFVAGFVHESRTLEEHQALLAQIDELCGHAVDIACSCGLGRRSREEALAIIDTTVQLLGGGARTQGFPISDGVGTDVSQPDISRPDVTAAGLRDAHLSRVARETPLSDGPATDPLGAVPLRGTMGERS
jgi:hypothetical protein